MLRVSVSVMTYTYLFKFALVFEYKQAPYNFQSLKLISFISMGRQLSVLVVYTNDPLLSALCESQTSKSVTARAARPSAA